jgi:hypothetical protein
VKARKTGVDMHIKREGAIRNKIIRRVVYLLAAGAVVSADLSFGRR